MNTIIVVCIVAIVIIFAVYSYIMHKFIKDTQTEYNIVETERDFLKEQNEYLKKELELQMQTNKVEAKMASKEKVSKPRGRKPQTQNKKRRKIKYGTNNYKHNFKLTNIYINTFFKL